MQHRECPRISAIVAMDEQRTIGKNNTLPWHLPADLQHFKRITTGHPIFMGRKTYESIGRPLPNRVNIILTSNEHFSAEGCVIVKSLAEGLKIAQENDSKEIFIIGGAEVFRQLMPQIDRLYLTIIHHQFTGDVFFPELNLAEWQEVMREDHSPNEDNRYAYSFITLDRKPKS